MAGTDQSAEDRTEAATPRRLAQARESGNVAVSRELASFAAMAAAAGSLYATAPSLLAALGRCTAFFLARSHEPSLVGPLGLRLAAETWLRVVLPVLAAAAVAAGAAVLLQTNFLLHLGAVAPKASRINPVTGIKRVFGADGLTELIRSLLKLALLAGVLWVVLRHEAPRVLAQALQDPHRLPSELGRLVASALIAGLGVQALVAVADVVWVRLRYARQMRMSRQEVKDEFRETEGNPQIKGRIRRIRMLRARRRMMQAVPKATVVVTNPTHYAVALSYDRARNAAPRVVAKGVDSLALRIREVAAVNRVPVVSNPPLARALYRLELDSDIPAEHYKAVAELIAYVWRLRRQMRQ